MSAGATRATRKRWAALGGAALAPIVALALPWPPDAGAAPAMAGVTAWMAVWWLAELAPLAITSLLPLIVFPALGILDFNATAASYAKSTIFLFLGGFFLALGLERTGAHRRLALSVVRAVGTRPARVVLGMMLASGLLSMAISNTAAALVLLPVALAVLRGAEEGGLRDPDQAQRFATALLLGIAYAASIGGMATPIGTPPNLVLFETVAGLDPPVPLPSFGTWVLVGVPASLFLMGITWALLVRFERLSEVPDVAADALSADEPAGAMSDERWAIGLFALAALAWVTGSGVDLGAVSLPGWRSVPALADVNDASVALLFALPLFLLPSRERPGEPLLDWPHAVRGTPWGLLLLFGGGFALAAGFRSSGLSALIVDALAGLDALPVALLTLLVTAAIVALTEFTSNTATTSLVLPLLAPVAMGLGISPFTLLLPATLAASCAFMMPIATPPNAIVFGSGRLSMRAMARHGLRLNVVALALVWLFSLLVAPG